MEEIDFADPNFAYDKLLELANCVDEKQNLLANDFDLTTLFDSNFDQIRLVTSTVGAAVRLNKVVEKYREKFELQNSAIVVENPEEKQDLIRERLNKKRYIPVYMIDLHVPDVVKDSDRKRIYTDIANFVNQYTKTVRRGELDGLCAYCIGKYPQLCENQWSGYEVMKIKVLGILKNRRNLKRKRNDDDY